MAAVLRTRGLGKRFGAFQALSDVDFSVDGGSVHALLGHNGAGKSTLINILSGAIPPSSGSVELGADTVLFSGPRQAAEAGIAVIHQHLSLVDTLSVSDNVFLGDEQIRRGFVDRSRQLAIAAGLLTRVGAACGPADLVAGLPMEQRQLVEIAKALHRDARVLILDEPTAALSDQEAQRLSGLVLQLRDQGLGIVYVTHLLSEVERLADRVTVLQDGRVRFSGDAAGLTRSDLVGLISGGSTVGQSGRRATTSSSAVLELADVTGAGFGPVTFDVAAGELVALFGMLGSGRRELLETIAGARRKHSGSIRVAGRAVDARSPRAVVRQGVCLVAGDRHRQGLLRGRSVAENIMVGSRRSLSRWGWRRAELERDLVESVSRDVALGASGRTIVDALSGGNQQKVVLARALAASVQPLVLLLDGPTQGVDVGSRADIYQSLRRSADEHGTAVVFSSSDPEEVLALADRVLVVRAGVVEGDLPVGEVTEAHLVSLASHGATT